MKQECFPLCELEQLGENIQTALILCCIKNMSTSQQCLVHHLNWRFWRLKFVFACVWSIIDSGCFRKIWRSGTTHSFLHLGWILSIKTLGCVINLQLDGFRYYSVFCLLLFSAIRDVSEVAKSRLLAELCSTFIRDLCKSFC